MELLEFLDFVKRGGDAGCSRCLRLYARNERGGAADYV